MNAEEPNQKNKTSDPTFNVRELISDAVIRLNDLDKAETKRIDEKFRDSDIKYQIQFTAAKEAVGIASTAQEKLVAQALDGTKEAINKADINTDKRFSLLSEKIDSVVETINKNTGSQGIYVTHDYLNNSFDKFRADIESMLKPIITKLADVTVFVNNQQGQQKGIGLSWSALVSVISVLGGLIAIFFALSK